MSQTDYARLQDVLMKELRLMHYPIAIKYFFDAAELERFKKEAEYYQPVKPLTFCQAEIGARMEGISVLMEEEKLGCTNAKFVFGWKGMDEGEVKSHSKYASDLEQAGRFVATKPRLPEGKLLAVAVTPLAATLFDPDVIHFYCDNMQAYHLLGDWMAVRDIHPLRPNLTVNSAACGGNVYVHDTGLANLYLACSGSYNSGKTERGEINVSIPGKDLPAMVARLEKRIADKGGAAITRLGEPFPGADICKNCPLITFTKGKAPEA
ncbi:protein of unknown function DUF169 [Desulfovibrio sp. X2]|uniref:DUF169 domain-containing protein n=1 Tax=Desulfovibrio sp. X2 TaxID=941449 RepID=UPI0003589258|nr:DUF169 domain-containing protein [Desulfovibrio sp. X2]EPR44285.1 protein of unknown function DUF169 [Desulfovibrio sp. X2]